MKDYRQKTIKSVLFNFLDEHEELKISGWQLYQYIHDMTGRNPYPTTLLTMVREYCDITGGEFHCIDHNKSIYHFRRLFPLGNAIIDRV